MEPCAEDDDLAGVDSKPLWSPYSGGFVPSILRFFTSYSTPDEARPIAQWLAKRTNRAIDVVPNDHGQWVFTESAKSCAERYYTRFDELTAKQNSLEQERIDDEQAALERRVDRIIENTIEHPKCRLDVNEDGESLT